MHRALLVGLSWVLCNSLNSMTSLIGSVKQLISFVTFEILPFLYTKNHWFESRLVMWLNLVTYLHHHGHDHILPWLRGKVCFLNFSLFLWQLFFMAMIIEYNLTCSSKCLPIYPCHHFCLPWHVIGERPCYWLIVSFK